MKKLNLKSEAEKIDSPGKRKMARFYIKKVDETCNHGSVLSLGCCSDVDKIVAKNCGLDYSYTISDLDYDIDIGRPFMDYFDNVFAFGVIEHLMNPLFCLNRLSAFITRDTKIYLSTPRRPHFFWTNCHFHEMDKKRFNHLIDSAGYKIVHHYKYNDWFFPPWKYIGFRPILRSLFGMYRRIHFYELRLK